MTPGPRTIPLIDGTLRPARAAFAALTIALVCITADEAVAQRGRSPSPDRAAPPWVQESWTSANGLPVNSINHIIQDRTGYIWVTTFDGLVRFDGARFTIYNTSNTPGLETNRLLLMHEARDGTLWITTEQRDLVRLRAGRFTSLVHDPGDAVTHVVDDSAGRVWVGTNRGLGLVRHDSIVAIGRATLAAPISSFLKRRDGTLWIGTSNGELYRLTRDGQLARASLDSALQRSPVHALYEDSSGTLWVATPRGFWSGRERLVPLVRFTTPDESGIAIFALPRTGEVIGLGSRGLHRLSPGSPTRTVRFDNRVQQVSVWADGAAVWHAAGDSIYRNSEPVAAIPRSPGGDTSDEVITSLRDREGSVWVGSSTRGLHRLKPALFTTYSVPEGLAHRNIYPVHADSSGGIWAGSWGFGISRIDARSGRVATWRRESGVPPYVFSFLDGRDGRKWIGTNGGLYSCRPGPRECRTDGPNELRGQEVRALHADAAGSIWAGSTAGLWRLDGSHWTRFQAREGAPGATVRVFAETRDGAIWMGTNGAGLARFAGGRFARVTVADGLPTDYVRALYEDADGWLWVGTEGRGLARLDTRAWHDSGRDAARGARVAVIAAKDGLFDETIHEILEDDVGRLWMNTNRGIFWIPRAELVAFANGSAPRVYSTSYTERDGMRNREGNGGIHPAGAKTSDGRLWFPTQDGVVMVDPARIRSSELAPPVVIEGVIARGGPETSDANESVTILPAQRDLQIEYTALTFLEPANVRFRYRLDGYDEDWVDAGNRRTAFYTQLPPGSYTFLVEASSERGIWNGKSAPLVLNVTPRFHETTLAKFLLGITIAAALVFGMRWRLSDARRRELELTRVVELRTATLLEREQQLKTQNTQLAVQASKLAELHTLRSRLFANLSHEFRTPLTLILGPLRGMLEGRHGDLSAPVREQGSLMLRNGQRLLRLINQVLDLARLQSGVVTLDRHTHDLVSFTGGITLAFSPLAEQRGIDLKFKAETDELPASVDAEQLEKVVLNLVSNALKFTSRGGEVLVVVRAVGDSHAEIAVHDTGVGIALADLPRVFERFYQADSSATRRYEGTGIGLALAKELVELHGGEIRVESAVGRGSTFTATLPLGTTADMKPPRHGMFTVSEEHPVTASSATVEDPQDDADQRTTALVVDDNADVRAYVRSVLAGTYRVIEAVDGNAGLLCARTMLPDLIVADVMMPDLDGLAMARALKDSPMTDAIPVVLVTARAADEDRIAGLETGVDAYLVKPFDPGVLEATVANLLAQRRRLRERFRAGEVLPAAAPTTVPDVPSALTSTLRPIVVSHLTDEEFGPDMLAEAAGMSYHQMYRALRDELQMTPSRFIRGVRVECASELLRQGAGSVTEVAYAVGFEALSHFSRAYREHFGVAPSAHVRA